MQLGKTEYIAFGEWLRLLNVVKEKPNHCSEEDAFHSK